MIKCILISFLLCITFSQMGKGNTNESQIQDIESSIIISTQGKKYFVVQLLRGLTEDGFYTRFLIVKKNKKTIARIAFPSSEDVKNLSVNINKNNNNCILECNYGGGENFYSRYFYFRCAKGGLYLYKIVGTHFIPDSDKKIIKKRYIHPQINIKRINFLYYLENTP